MLNPSLSVSFRSHVMTSGSIGGRGPTNITSDVMATKGAGSSTPLVFQEYSGFSTKTINRNKVMKISNDYQQLDMIQLLNFVQKGQMMYIPVYNISNTIFIQMFNMTFNGPWYQSYIHSSTKCFEHDIIYKCLTWHLVEHGRAANLLQRCRSSMLTCIHLCEFIQPYGLH